MYSLGCEPTTKIFLPGHDQPFEELCLSDGLAATKTTVWTTSKLTQSAYLWLCWCAMDLLAALSYQDQVTIECQL